MTAISCDCSAYIDSDELCQRYSIAERKGWEEHVCCECRERIKIGQKYMEESGICGHHEFRESTCLPCFAIRRRYCPSGWYWGELRNQIMDCLGFDYTEVPPEDEWDAIDEEDAARVSKARYEREHGKGSGT